MWALYSMLRSTVNFKHNVDISKYAKLIAFLKKQNLGYQPTKSSTFTKDNVENFLKNAPFHFLPLKAALVIGISGACRSDELFKMKTADVDLEEHRAVIVIPSTQSYQPRSFLITNIAWLEILKSYVNLRKNVEGDRFFLQLRHGKLTKQPYGHNSISQFPKKIATYLQLSNANTYTGYCFRRTAARLRANDSGGTRHFKKVGRWNATTVAETRVGTSLDGQVEDPVNVPSVTVPDPSSSSPQSHVSKEQLHEEVDLKMEDHDNDTFNVDCFLYPEDLELRESAEKVPLNLLPEKSKLRYEKTYKYFRDWCSKKGAENFTSESVILAYFDDVAKTKKPSTMWAHYSMLRSTVNSKDNVDISKYSKLIAYLKKENLGYQPTKSSTFTKENVDNFLKNAPFHFLPLKAALVIGVSGACRSDELFKMKTADVDLQEHRAIVVIPRTQSYQPRSFLVTNIKWVEILKWYVRLRKSVEGDRFFLQLRHGKLTKQPYGHNSIAQFPKKIATYLQLSNVNTYTGHCFRRTAATLRTNGGGDTRNSKKLKGWNATTVAEACVGTSLEGQEKIEDPVSVPGPSSSVWKEELHEEVDLKMEDHDNDTLDFYFNNNNRS
ncbi:uncharacterized protein LOC135127784 isoform X2 [Zophobas morio]|uniref:uncharacterized protein LOC135127784 isoform X2 n=1 Tax=Zophobas morio TaxID=2755281 RepID=UPI003082E08C